VNLNLRKFLTVNSQPAVNGEKSSHPIFGWGPKNGYVYQKAYLECFCPPETLEPLLEAIEKDPNITFHAVNRHGDLRTNTYSDGPNAVTWGVYPGKEIIQPTIVETVSFLAWKVGFSFGSVLTFQGRSLPSWRRLGKVLSTGLAISKVDRINHGLLLSYQHRLQVPSPSCKAKSSVISKNH
jgi:hypothetical protein